ncbi:MAG: hypothetical protein HY695_22285 [Deltaproteobacteria bacterium]|nr:hypothetical protein [Deltaproteobacteria bacterium]
MDNRTQTQDRDLLEAATIAARQFGLRIDVLQLEPQLGAARADALIRIRHDDQEILYAAEVKRGLRPSTLGAVLHQLEHLHLGQTALLVTDYVTPPLADALKERGIAFLDAAGNAYLDHPPLLVWVKGQRPKETPVTANLTTRTFNPGGLKVLFPLLCRPEWANRPYREIAQLAGVAHGTVGWVLAELPKLGFMAEVAGKRRLLQPERLLQQWVEAYARTLRPRLLLGRFHTDLLDWYRTLDPKYGCLLGGEPAAARLTQHLRPGTVTLYGQKVEPRLLLDQRLRRDPQGEVEILTRFWKFDNEDPLITPLPLVYADLLAIGDARCLETAKLLYADIVARFGR